MTSTDSTEVPDYLAMLRLDGKVFTVLGAGQGIGRQTAHALAQAGASVHCIDRDPILAKEIADEVGGRAFVADVRDRAQVEAIFADAQELGPLAGIVDIVGAARFGPFLESTDDDWAWTYEIVLRQALLAGQIGGRILAANGGGVITYVASISGLTSSPMHAVYGVAKAGLMSLVRTMAIELGPKGVRVNAVAPAGTWTPRMAESMGTEGRAEVSAVVSLGRIAEPSDIASGLLFLSSDLAGFVTGQTLVVDGGGHQRFPYPIAVKA